MPIRPVQFVASNRLERLADLLADRVAGRVGDPLEGEVIVVQSRGMATWLEQRIADRGGVSFGCRFPFPRHLLFEVARAVAPEHGLEDAFSPERMTWRLHAELGRIAKESADPVWAPVTGYLRDDPTGLRRFQLAGRLARLFDDYLVYRPGWLLAWEGVPVGPGAGGEPPGDPDALWQGRLWRRLVEGSEGWHPARLGRELLARLKRPGARFNGLPQMLSIFGISSLSPFHLALFDALAGHCEVTFFRLEPCADYWGEIPTRRELLGNALSGVPQPEDRGHRLLRAWGRQGREFQRQVLEFDWDPGDEEEFVGPGGDSMLAELQRGLLHLPDAAEPGASGGATSPDEPLGIAENEENRLGGSLRPTDVGLPSASVQVHVCHGPLRELQVLRDHLLSWFAEGVAPREVLVLTPRIETYAPLLPAVFGGELGGGPRIPWSVSDRSRRSGARLAGAFERLLALAGSRLEVDEVLLLLEEPAVLRRFGLSDAGLRTVRDWLRETPVWWGLDVASRTGLGLGTEAVGTWRRGVDRLLLGHAMDSGTGAMVDGIVPMPAISGDRAEAAGALAEFVAVLEVRLKSWESPRTPADWSAALHSAFGAFFLPGALETDDVAVVRDALSALAAVATGAMAEPVPLAIVAESLRTVFESGNISGGFLSGGVTFCALQPMRSVPARVICVIGLSDDAFPRRPFTPEFDLMSRHPMPGDASRGEDDRYLFLETVISARERLYLSHPGLSVRDATEAPPSVVVGDLLDSLAERWGDAAAAAVVVRHRLHPWSAAYFAGDVRRFTHSPGAAEAARLLAAQRVSPAPFCARPLPPPEGIEDGPVVVELADLHEFLANAARFFCERRLGIRLPRAGEELPGREPFAMEGLARFGIRGELVDLFLDGGAEAAVPEARWRETGRLPLGESGRIALDAEVALARQFAAVVAGQRAAGSGAVREVSLTVGTRILRGRITETGPSGPVHHRAARLRARDQLALWLDLLVTQCVRESDGDPVRAEGRLVYLKSDEPQTLLLAAPEAAGARLAELLDLFSQALMRPVPLIPECGLAFAGEMARAGGDASEWQAARAMRAAREAWDGGDFQAGDSADAYAALCFARCGGDPLAGDFAAVSASVFAPLIEAAEKPSKGRKKKP